MSDMPVYETWLERNGHIETVVTDAPGGIRFVDADEYHKLKSERDRLQEALNHALKGDLDPEDRVIIAQILDGTALQDEE